MGDLMGTVNLSSNDFAHPIPINEQNLSRIIPSQNRKTVKPSLNTDWKIWQKVGAALGFIGSVAAPTIYFSQKSVPIPVDKGSGYSGLVVAIALVGVLALLKAAGNSTSPNTTTINSNGGSLSNHIPKKESEVPKPTTSTTTTGQPLGGKGDVKGDFKGSSKAKTGSDKGRTQKSLDLKKVKEKKTKELKFIEDLLRDVKIINERVQKFSENESSDSEEKENLLSEFLNCFAKITDNKSVNGIKSVVEEFLLALQLFKKALEKIPSDKAQFVSTPSVLALPSTAGRYDTQHTQLQIDESDDTLNLITDWESEVKRIFGQKADICNVNNLKREEKKSEESSLYPINHGLLKEMGLEILSNSTDLEKAAQCIDKFDIKAKFLKALWSLANYCATERLPLNLKIWEEGFSDEKYEEFKRDLKINIENMYDFISEIENYPELKKAYEAVCGKLLEIDLNTASFKDEVEKIYNERRFNDLASLNIVPLKMDDKLIMQLKLELKKIEREKLMEFLSSLAILTLEGKNQTSQKITEGLEKLRRYMIERDPKLEKSMGFCQQGTPQKVYDFCLNSLFLTDDEKENFIAMMSKKYDADLEVTVASLRHSSEKDYSSEVNTGGHYTCDVLADNNIFNLDSIGSQKKPGSSLIGDNDALLVLSDSFYQKCQPLPLEKMSVPRQNSNNCYLSAGWLKFCVFLHYFRQVP
jgi:hypothetical protein